MAHRPLWISFRDALAGIRYVVQSQRNARIECGAGVAACALAGALGLPARDWAILALTVAVVLAAEMGNSAVERIVDLVCPDPHDLARIAKDASAGAVLVLSIGAAAVGLCLFGPPLWALIGAHW